MRFFLWPPSHFPSVHTRHYPIFLRKNLLLRKLRKIFFVSVFLSDSRPSRPLPSFIVRCLRWLIRGCRRNQESMPSSPKVLMGGKIWKNSFYAEKFLRNLHASSDSRASTRLRSFILLFLTCFLRLSSSSSFLNFPTNISFHFSVTPESSGEVS